MGVLGFGIEGFDPLVGTLEHRDFPAVAVEEIRQFLGDVLIDLLGAGADHHIFDPLLPLEEMVVHLLAPGIKGLVGNIVVFLKALHAPGEIAVDFPAIRGEHGGLEAAALKLAIHHQTFQHRLTHMSEAHDHGFEVLGGFSVFVEGNAIAGRTDLDQQPGGQTGLLEGGDEAVAVFVSQNLHFSGGKVFLAQNDQAGLLRADAPLFQSVQEQPGIVEVFRGVAVQGVENHFPLAGTDADALQETGLGIQGAAVRAENAAFQGVGVDVGTAVHKDHHGIFSGHQLLAEVQGIFVQPEDHIQLSPAGQPQPKFAQGVGTEGGDHSAGGGEEGDEVNDPEQALGPGALKQGRFLQD